MKRKELSQTIDLQKFRHGTSTVANVVNNRPTTVAVASLSHWARLPVYHCAARDGREAARRAGSSASAETCLLG